MNPMIGLLRIPRTTGVPRNGVAELADSVTEALMRIVEYGTVGLRSAQVEPFRGLIEAGTALTCEEMMGGCREELSDRVELQLRELRKCRPLGDAVSGR